MTNCSDTRTKNPHQSEDFFGNFTSCLCCLFDFFIQEDVAKQSKKIEKKSKTNEFKDLLQKNNIIEITFDYNNNANEIKYGSSVNYKELTKDLVNFIKNEYANCPEVVEALNELPQIGNEKQDKKLIEIAYKLAKEADQEEKFNNPCCEIQPAETLKDSLKREIITMNSNKNCVDHFDQISREGNDFLITVTDLFFCCTRTRDSNPKTIINKQSYRTFQRAR